MSESESSEQIEVLRGIWQSIKDLGQNLGGRIDQTNSRLDQVNARLDQTNSRLDDAVERLARLEDRMETAEESDKGLRSDIVSMDLRLGTELITVHGDLVVLIEHLKSHQADAARLNQHESKIRALEQRVSSLESSS
ncbi:MAG: hypothetical protein JNK60_00335 [Acidobacteria bacterium]|nr:hypothetical protein [Acidobacteriota bacterium]